MAAITNVEIIQCLRNSFGLVRFKDYQLEVIEQILSGKDGIYIFKTGFGKSLCFQLPTVLKGDITIVISPLVALMKDQVEKLNALNIKCLNVTTEVDNNVKVSEVMLHNGENIRFIFTTPEKFYFNMEFVNILKTGFFSNQIGRIIIDEAHCLLEWGEKFRPAYLGLRNLKTLFSNIQVCCFSATLKEDDINNIKTILSLTDPNIATIYHSKLDVHVKNENFRNWETGQKLVICSTVALGMGIDKSDIKYIIHATTPTKLNHYLQETGRVARGGGDGFCMLFYNTIDINHHISKITKGTDSVLLKEKGLNDLFEVVKYGECGTCRMQMLLHGYKYTFTKKEQEKTKSFGQSCLMFKICTPTFRNLDDFLFRESDN